MKNVALTLLMMLVVGVGTSRAQDKKAETKEVKTEATVAKKHECTAAQKAACWAKKGGKAAADSKAWAPGCEKACCTADAGKATKEEHNHKEGEKHDHPH